MRCSVRTAVAGTVTVMLTAGAPALRGQAQQGEAREGSGFRFRTGVALINVTATVTDANGRFVSGLRQDDFVVYEDDVPQTVTHFNADRVPVSLGIALDTSGSMAGEKFEHAERALDRFLFELLEPSDEVFLYRFSTDVFLEQGWTTDRNRLTDALRRIVPRGGTAMYDAIAEGVPLADRGTHRRKALLVISDGNDTSSATSIGEVKQLIRESEVMVYAIGIDGTAQTTRRTGPMPRRPPVRVPFPFPIPGRRQPWPTPPVGGGGGSSGGSRLDDRVNAGALRSITDDTGGRTEIVRSSRDLEPATAHIADELSRQYVLAYPAAAEKDGRWHTIRVEAKDPRYKVRARRGYIAN